MGAGQTISIYSGNNTGIGTGSLSVPPSTSGGTYNTAIGSNALAAVTTGYSNTGLGARTGNSLTDGYGNVCVGDSAGAGLFSHNYFNVLIGNNAGSNTNTGNYNVIIGSNSGISLGNTSNNILLCDGQGNIRLQSDSTGKVSIPGFLSLSSSNIGKATMTAGSVTVSNTLVTSSSVIQLTCQALGGTQGFLRVGTIVANTSFQILSSNGADTSTIGWTILN